MMNRLQYISIFAGLIFGILLLQACGVEVENTGYNGSSGNTSSEPPEWLIPESEVFSAQGRDGIPSIDDPKFLPVEEIDFIEDDRLILGVRVGNEIRGYPHQIMDWHEIVNDTFEEKNMAVTYCPLTGTGISWDRGQNEFGVSGLLFRNNLIPYDRNSNSHWSQMQLRSVEGWRQGVQVEFAQTVEMNWDTWKQAFPNSDVLSKETGFDRNYDDGAGYITPNSGGSAILFPVKNVDNRLQKTEKVHAVIASNTADEDAVVRAYQIKYFEDEISVINDTLNNQQIVVAGSLEGQFMVSFYAELDNEIRHFEAIQDSLPLIMKDENGNRFDLFGKVIQGPDKGAQLKAMTAYTGYWFAIADFFPSPQIFGYDEE